MNIFAEVHLTDSKLTQLNSFLEERKESFSKIFVLLDDNVFDYCWQSLVTSCPLLQNVELLQIDAGEEHKTLDLAQQLWLTLTERGADRNSLLINLGGGVITDLGGFVAATFKRGMPFINIPSTLLGMVDAALGGKTGVDLEGLKNQVGVFAKPEAIFLVPHFLDTLPETELLSGFAECVKHALIDDLPLWEKIKNEEELTVELAKKYLWEFTLVKKRIVEIDPTEKLERKKLNYGHTFGHALETHLLNSGNKVTHGACIVFGMLTENYLAFKSDLMLEADFKMLEEKLLKWFPNLPTYNKEVMPAVIDLMKHDKKNFKNQIRFSLITEAGNSVVNKVVEPALFEEAMEYYLKIRK
jgi:3-dehydroquinate synthase